MAAVATFALAGCNSDAPPPATAATPATAAAAIAAVPPDALRARAAEAMAERRYFTPAGASAAELLLELRARGRTTTGDEAALGELQPYLVIAVEQAIERREPEEAARLLGLLRRVDATAPALPRLDAAVAGARNAAVAARATAERATAAAAATTAPVPTPPASRAVAATIAPAADPARAPRATAAAPATAAPPQSVPSEPVQAPTVVAARPAPAEAETEAPARAAPALRLVQDARPRYPARALDRRIDGRVEIMFTVLPDGSVSDLRVVDAQPAGMFEQAALQAARRWRFAPIASATTTSRSLRFTPPPG